MREQKETDLVTEEKHKNEQQISNSCVELSEKIDKTQSKPEEREEEIKLGHIRKETKEKLILVNNKDELQKNEEKKEPGVDYNTFEGETSKTKSKETHKHTKKQRRKTNLERKVDKENIQANFEPPGKLAIDDLIPYYKRNFLTLG